jgi:alkaline phosphatase
MKRIAFCVLMAACFGVAAFAQVVDQGRDLSKYADDKFGEDDKYTVETPYQTVKVSPVKKNAKIKNVILLIGDGMGLEQISTGWVLNGGHLNLDNFPVAGYSRTWVSDRLVTDSSAGGTAISSGIKTKYGYIGVDDNGAPVESILHYAQSKGMKTGVTVTCRINDSTPADFVCHSTDRHEEEAIAAQYVGCGVDFLSGGGLKFWKERSDGRDLVSEMQALGYTFVDDLEGIRSFKGDKFLGLFAPLDMDPVLDRGPILRESARKAIEVLDNRKGFFLMIEGSQIDDWAHRNKVGHMAEELFEFDKIIGDVLEFAQKDGHTLVIVTADHATGGLTLIDGSLEDRSVKVHFSTK